MNWKYLLCLVPLILGCDGSRASARGFRLPDGNPEAGKAAFLELACVSCHSVEGVEFDDSPERSIDVRLGGKVHRVRSYGELVTAIIHPSEGLAKGYPVEAVSRAPGKSLMFDVNDAMTVQQMIDLVAFLQAQYIEYLPREYDPYFP